MTTAERRHRCFNFSTWCQTSWHGPVWPFESSKLGTALIHALHDVRHRASYATFVRPADFFGFLATYARMHTRGRARDVPNGEPFVGESFHGDDGYWLTREIMYQRNTGDRRRGDHYFHSSFCDLVLSGLVGLHVELGRAEGAGHDRQSPLQDLAALLVVEPLFDAGALSHFAASSIRIRGRDVAVAFDGSGGAHYGFRGLAVWVDSALVAHRPTLDRIVVPLP